MALGVQASWALGLASLKTSFNFANKQVRSRYVVRYTQAYYTVDLDAPQSPSALFGTTTSRSTTSRARWTRRTRPRTSRRSPTAAWSCSRSSREYSARRSSAPRSTSRTPAASTSRATSRSPTRTSSRKSKITAFILGGDAGTAAQTIDSYEALIDFIKTGGNYSRESPGAPIAYKLSYLKDNSPARMSFTTDYEVKDCVRVSQKVKVTLQLDRGRERGGDRGDDLELYGHDHRGRHVDARRCSTRTRATTSRSTRASRIGSATQPLAEAVIEVDAAGRASRSRCARTSSTTIRCSATTTSATRHVHRPRSRPAGART